jgi:glycerol-3-phosphate acyltransferase PlsY
MVLEITLLIIAAYVLGSIPSAVWIGKGFYGIDVREHGSHNAGTTNVLRVLGKKAAIPVFAIDCGKGFAAVMLFHLSSLDTMQEIFFLKMGLVVAVVLGHIFPLFAGFRGGKGVATMTGAVLGVYPPAVLLCLATFLVVLAITHYVSIGSMTAGVLFPIYTAFVFHQTYLPLIIFGCIIAVVLIITHYSNIKRLLAGTESKIYLFPKKHQTED